MARKATDLVNLTFRLPEALRQRLANEAEKANRSLNSEILWRLGQTFSDQWQAFIAGVEDHERQKEENLEKIMRDPRTIAAVKKVYADLQAGKFPGKKKKEGSE